MKINHNFYLNLAFNLAEKNLGKTKKNPSVGCVVVKNNTVISSGVTSIDGRPHAEYNALNKNINFSGSNMYVTLEPCTHFGVTPPCTDIIKRKKIKKVYYSFKDPDIRTFNKAKLVLKKTLKIDKIEKKNENFYKSYFLNKIKKFPLVDAKLAISKDFYTINKTSEWITNHKSRRIAHFIRSKYDCIVSTSRTINKDNSLLNCRLDGFNNFKPDLIIIDNNLKLKKNLKLFSISNKRKTYIFTSSNDQKKINYFKKRKIKIIKINQLRIKKDFKILFDKIFKLGKGRVLIETGLIFLNELIRYKFINELYLFQSNILLKKKGLNNANISLVKKLKFGKNLKVNLKNDKLFKIRVK